MKPIGLTIATLASVLVACTGSTVDTSQGLAGPETEPTVAKLPAGWNEIKPGGETICSRGGEYAYWAKPGKVNRLIIDFIGGGACWNKVTCSVAGQIFSPTVDDVRKAVAKNQPHGIYQDANPDNPFAGWHHVIVPYCTGDIHWGNAKVDYGDGVVINHRGAVNTKAVLAWVYANYSAPEQILVTGCSAGSYGSSMWAAHIADHYPKSRVIQFGDSGAGIITPSFFEQSFPNWNAKPVFPTWIAGLDPNKVDVLKLALVDLYANLAGFYKQHQFSQYNTAFDENQTFYFTAMGGMKKDWSPQMLASLDAIEKRAPAFAAFVPSGEQHCILGFDNFYTVNAGGVRLVDWLRDMVAGKQVADRKCDSCSGKTP
jgi:hypothetical protein